MSYRIPKKFQEAWERAIFFIAHNDEPLDRNFESVCGYVTVILVSETFSVSTEKVARAVLKARRKELEKAS